MTDRLGSVRANGSGERFAYYPYGEERGTSADGREKFGTYVRDSAGQDYADQRYYGVGTGRFGGADPLGILAVQPGIGSTWNRYAYVHGDPVNYSDPSGTNEAAPDGGGNIGPAGPCGSNWINDPSLVGPCPGEGGGGTGGWGGGGGASCGGVAMMGFVPAPDPSCYMESPPHHHRKRTAALF